MIKISYVILLIKRTREKRCMGLYRVLHHEVDFSASIFIIFSRNMNRK